MKCYGLKKALERVSMRHHAIEIETFDTIDRLKKADSTGGVVQILSDAIQKHGFESFLIADLPPQGSAFERFIILNSWPANWFEHYVKKRYYDVDPVAVHARNTTDPFYWSEAVEQAPRRRSPLAAQVMAEAADNGLKDGMVVPIVGSVGDQSCVTMGGTRRDHDPRSRNALTLLSMFAVHKAREIRLQKRSAATFECPSPRELECLSWVAVGKTDEDIGEILGIQADTVGVHVRRATAKLDACTRTQAVVIAMQRGLLRL